MSNTTTATAPVVSDPIADVPVKETSLVDFVKKAVATYNSDLTAFKGIATGVCSDASKLYQTAVHISKVSSSIATDYCKQTGKTGDFVFSVASQLVVDSRVGKALGYVSDLWDKVPEMPQFADAVSFNDFVLTIQAQRAYDRYQAGGCCWA